MRKLITIICVLAGIMLGAGTGFCADTIKIGHPGDFSGVYSFYDVPVRDGARFAIQEINRAGGVLGRPMELIARDCRNDQGLGVRLTEELIRMGVVYIIGTTGDPIIAQGTVACAAGIPISTGDGTAPTLVADMGPCAFHLAMSDNVQGAVAAKYAYDQGYRNAYVIQSTEIPYTKNLPMYFKAAFEKLGGKVLGIEQYRIDAGDYSAQVTKIANLKRTPDVIFTPMFIPDTPIFMRQLRAAGVEIPVISSDGNHDESLMEAGKAVEGLVITTHGYPTPGSPFGDLWERYTQAQGKPPASVAIGVGYDEAYIVKTAIEKAGSAKPAAIIEALRNLKGFKGVMGEYTMDPQTRRSRKPVALLKVSGGKFKFIDQFYPDFVPNP